MVNPSVNCHRFLERTQRKPPGIIQVADDYLISVERLTTALRFAVKNGFTPTIDSLAQLADRFNSISATRHERAAEMVKIFGRNWTALIPMLQAGGDAIKKNAAAISTTP